MYITSLMVLVNPCGSLPTMEKLSSVMLCPVVWKWLKMGEGALRCSLYLSPKFLPVCLPYVFHCASWLMASVSVYNSPFLDGAVLVLMCYQKFLDCVGTFEVNLYSYFATYVSETLTETFGVWDYYENVVFIGVPMEVCVAVPLYFTELEIQFVLKPVENTVRVVTPAECCSDVLVFLFQKLLVGANILDPV